MICSLVKGFWEVLLMCAIESVFFFLFFSFFCFFLSFFSFVLLSFVSLSYFLSFYSPALEI